MQLFKRILVLLGLSMLCRVVFYFYNSDIFSDIDLWPFVMGVRIDLSVIAWGGFPLLLLTIINSFFINSKIIYKVNLGYYFLFLILIILLNFIDVGMYGFTFSRFSVDTLSFLFHGNDFANVIPTAIKDYWFLALAVLLMAYLLYQLDKKHAKNPFLKGYKRVGYFLFIPFMVLAARGGWQLKPITIIDASLYVNSSHVPIVLSGPFSLFTTLVEGDVSEPDVMKSSMADSLFSIECTFLKSEKSVHKNVVVLIMESFGDEYLKAGYLPFLDSLKDESLYFNNAYANGKRSVDAVPAIFASIPDLSLKSYIYSKYAGNNINSLPRSLGKKGYNTSFYHGGRNGTMSFDKFTSIAGFEEYYGLDEYPNVEDYDGTWGVYDEPFLLNYVNELTRKSKGEEPFFSSLFTLSSHHPFVVPKKYKDKFSGGTHPIHETLQYADYSLKRFFEEARKQLWFKNTLFVITADHTSIPQRYLYFTDLGKYKVPLLFYDPSNKELKGVSEGVAQHIDIYPSVLSYIGVQDTIKTFGNDLFSELKSERGVLNRSNGIFCYYTDSVFAKASMSGLEGVFSVEDTLMRNKIDDEELNNRLLNEVYGRFQVYKDVLGKNGYY